MTEEYLDEVTQAFLSHIGRGLMLSPRDRTLVERWFRAGIPAEVVVAGIRDAFSTKPKRRVFSISFAQSSVERAAEAWRNRLVGIHLDEDQVEVDVDRAFIDLKNKIQVLTDGQLNRPIREIMLFLLYELSHIQTRWRTDSSFDCEKALESLETQVCERALGAFEECEQHEIERQVESAISSMAFASSHARIESRIVFRNRRIRSKLGLPPLQLAVSGEW